MIRAGAPRSITQSLTHATQCATRRPYIPTLAKAQLTSSARPSSLALAARKPSATALQRFASTHPGTAFDHIDKKREDKLGKSEIEADPDAVSIDSSVRHVFREEGVEEREKETDMLAGVKQDLVSTSKGCHDRDWELDLPCSVFC